MLDPSPLQIGSSLQQSCLLLRRWLMPNLQPTKLGLELYPMQETSIYLHAEWFICTQKQPSARRNSHPHAATIILHAAASICTQQPSCTRSTIIYTHHCLPARSHYHKYNRLSAHQAEQASTSVMFT